MSRNPRLAARFAEGTVIERGRAGRVNTYTVVGYTERGKTRLRRDREGTEMACWWDKDWLPKGYRVRP